MPNHKITIRVQTKRDTFYCSNPEVVSEEDFREVQGFMGQFLDQDHGFVSVIETDGSEVFIPREEVAAIIVYKQEAEDE